MIRLIYECLKQQCKSEHDYILNRVDKVFFTIKAIIAIALHLEAIKQVDIYRDKYILVAVIDGGTSWTEWGQGGWYEGVMISLKWNEWRYIISGDSYP